MSESKKRYHSQYGLGGGVKYPWTIVDNDLLRTVALTTHLDVDVICEALNEKHQRDSRAKNPEIQGPDTFKATGLCKTRNCEEIGYEQHNGYCESCYGYLKSTGYFYSMDHAEEKNDE